MVVREETKESCGQNGSSTSAKLKSANISGLKMKAIAMKWRHKLHKVNSRHNTPRSTYTPMPSTLTGPVEDAAEENDDKKNVPNNIDGLRSIFKHPFCILLVAFPLGMASWYWNWGPAPTFWLNLLALIPLAKILGDGTEELAASLKNDTLSGLLNATLGNAVEMILTVQLLKGGHTDVVKSTLLGSVLSNILLVLGTAFLFGGLIASAASAGRHHVIHIADYGRPGCCAMTMEKEQLFSVKGALVNMALQLLACMTCALPTVFASAIRGDDEDTHRCGSASVLEVSRVGAGIIIISYFAYIFFQLVTHRRMLSKDEGEDGDDGDDGEGEAGLTISCSLTLMFVTTVIIAVGSEFLVEALGEVVKGGIPRMFIGIILLPFAGNACEHASAIRFAMQDRPGLAIGIAVGSSTQIALLVMPFSVLMGWLLDVPMDLDLGRMNTTVMILSVLVVLTLVMDGRSNWLKGFMLCVAYLFIAALYWYIPEASASC